MRHLAQARKVFDIELAALLRAWFERPATQVRAGGFAALSPIEFLLGCGKVGASWSRIQR